MKILRNHFGGRPTILIGNKVINGCQDFDIANLDSVCDKYEVPQHYRDDVREANKLPETHADNMNEFLDDEDVRVLCCIAEHGNDAHRDILVKHSDVDVLWYVAKYGNDAHRDILVKHSDIQVLRCVARYGNDAHRDILVKHSDVGVLWYVARYGNDNHRRIIEKK